MAQNDLFLDDDADLFRNILEGRDASIFPLFGSPILPLFPHELKEVEMGSVNYVSMDDLIANVTTTDEFRDSLVVPGSELFK
jgi:hypothetical protein